VASEIHCVPKMIIKMIIKAAKKIFNSNKICRSYSDLNFGVTFLEHSVDVNGRPVGRPENIMLSAYYCWRTHSNGPTCHTINCMHGRQGHSLIQ